MADATDLAPRAVSDRQAQGGRFVVRVDTLVSLALIAALIALVALVAVQAVGARRDAGASSDRAAAVSAARAEVLALTQISPATSDASIQKLIAGATDDFQAQLQDQAEAIRSAVKESKVTSTGTIASAGIVSLKGDKARVLVASSGSVKNTKTKAATPRTYRLDVRLERVKGRWLVAGLEFVA